MPEGGKQASLSGGGRMTTPKRHHIVPQTILKKFCGNDEKLRVKRTHGREDVFCATPRNAFVQKDLYTWPQAKDPAILEKALSEIESNFAPLAERAEEAAKPRVLPEGSFSEQERRAAIAYFRLQIVRTPEARRIADKPQHLSNCDPQNNWGVATALTIDEVRKAEANNGPLPCHGQLTKALWKCQLHVMIVASEHGSFLIGDTPVVIFDNGAFVTPVSPQVAVMMIPPGEMSHLVDSRPEMRHLMKQVNRHIWRYSEAVGAPTKKQLRQLCKQARRRPQAPRRHPLQ